MQLLTTKCLNTAVLLLYFMLGTKGLEHAEYCDSGAIKERHLSNQDSNPVVLKEMRSKILDKRGKTRKLFYILMNDNMFPYPPEIPREEDAFFPGHVFIIEKIPASPEPYYYIYQSYINEYDLNGHIQNMEKKKGGIHKAPNTSSLQMTRDEVRVLLNKISYILGAGTWDDKCIQYWKDFTFVDTSDIRGSITASKLFICCASSSVYDCVENIEKYVQGKIGELRQEMKNGADMDIVYGNRDMYHSSQIPLCKSEMYTQLQSMLNTIQDHKNKIRW